MCYKRANLWLGTCSLLASSIAWLQYKFSVIKLSIIGPSYDHSTSWEFLVVQSTDSHIYYWSVSHQVKLKSCGHNSCEDHNSCDQLCFYFETILYCMYLIWEYVFILLFNTRLITGKNPSSNSSGYWVEEFLNGPCIVWMESPYSHV